MDVLREQVYGLVSVAVSAGDGLLVDSMIAQPPVLITGLAALTNTPAGAPTGVNGVSAPMQTWAELIRRMFTHLTSPSAIISGGASGFAIHVVVPSAAPTSGIHGMMQGVPFVVGAAGNLIGTPTAAMSTTSNQIRKVLVTMTVSALPAQGGLNSANAAVQFIYGSAMVTSASVVNSGGASSYFDLVPLPLPSAGEIPVGWLNVPNNFPVSTAISATMMWSDLRAVQGLNLSALLQGRMQP